MDQRMDQCQGGLHYLSMNLDRVELFGSHMFIEHRLDLGIVDRQAVRSVSPRTHAMLFCGIQSGRGGCRAVWLMLSPIGVVNALAVWLMLSPAWLPLTFLSCVVASHLCGCLSRR